MVAVEMETPVRHPLTETGNISGRPVPIDRIVGWSEGDPPSKEFVESIGYEDMIYPVLVRQVGWGENERYEIRDGRRRVRAASILEWPMVPVILEGDEEPRDQRVTSLITNFQRSDNLIGNARDVWSLMDDGKSEKEIADLVGVSIAKIRALRDMRNLRPELIEAVELGLMKSWAARMAARHGEEVQAELVRRYQENDRVTSDDVKEVRSVGRKVALSDVADLFDDLPENDYSGTGDDATDDEEPVVSGLSSLPRLEDAKPKTKISRQDRLANVKNLASQARKEILAIKSNSRSDDENDILTFLNEILDRLQNPSE